MTKVCRLRILHPVAATLWLGVSSLVTVANAAEIGTVTLDHVEQRFGQYCFDCHGHGSEEGGLNFEMLAKGEYGEATREKWEAIWKNLRAETMPPPDAERPDSGKRAEWSEWITSDVFQLDPSRVDPGKVVVRRLNRAEYRETILNLTGVDFPVNEEFPADDTGYGFDTIGEVLMVSPVLLEKYLQASGTILSKAIPLEGPVAPEQSFGTDQWRLDRVDGEAGHQVGFEKPVSFFKKVSITHPGPYTLKLQWNLDNAWTRNLTEGTLELHLVSGGETESPMKSTPLSFATGTEGSLEIQFVAEPGEVEFRADFKPTNNDPKALNADYGDIVYQFRIRRGVLTGPQDGSRVQYREGAEKILFNGTPPVEPEAQVAHAREVIERFANRAFRRPIDDATLDRLCDVVRQTIEVPGKRYEQGIYEALRLVLASPRFIYRIELPRDGELPETVKTRLTQGTLKPAPGSVLIDEFALASRLSYFLWGGPPDDPLLNRAGEGTLYENLDAEIDRMLGQEWRLRRGVTNFVGQWLQTRDVHNIEFDLNQVLGGPKKAGEVKFDWAVKQGMIDETEGMFRYLIEADRPVTELLNARYTFLNEALATYYGVEGVQGGHTRKVDLPESSRRRGVLTHGAVLLVTSNPTRTSPVKRGLFIMENLLGTPAPPAPPNVPALEDAKKGDLKDASLRRILEQHRSDPACASCHQRMDPLGLALEHYNAIGQYRDEEPGEWSWRNREASASKPIDAAGVLLTGESFSTVEELADILAQNRRDDFYHCLSEKMMTYALGRGMTYKDALVLDDIVHQLRQNDGKMRTLIRAIVTSVPFTHMPSENLAVASNP